MSSLAKAFRGHLFANTALAGVALASGVSIAPAALAQSAPPQEAQAAAASTKVDDVTVTSRLREEKAQDVPQPVAVVGGKTADREHIERLQEFAQKVPNFNFFVGNPRGSGVNIRGTSGAFNSADGAESAVGFIVDNVFYTHTGFQWADYVDLQSLEIARGPQGTLLGKNTTAGAVVIHTQLPAFARSATLETSYGNRNRVTEKLNVTGPIIDDQLAYRATFFLDKSDGFIHDKVTGAGLLNNDRWGVRGQLLYVGDNFTDRLIFERLRSDEYNNYNALWGDSIPFFANGTTARRFSQNVASRLGKPILSLDPYNPYLTRLGHLDQRTHGLSNEINYQIGENTLTAITAWRDFVLHPRNSLGPNFGNELEIQSVAFDTYVAQFSQEIRLASPKEQELEWQIGFYGLREHIWSYRHDDYGSDASQWFSNNINTNSALLNGVTVHQDGKAKTTSFALFGQATWHIDQQWALTAGLRDTYEIKNGSDFGWISGFNSAFSLQQTFNAVAQSRGGVTGFDTGGVRKFNNSLSGLINPSYRYNENVLVYGSVARGEKSGAVNTNAIPILDSARNFKEFQPVIIKPEVTWDYELGAKTNWLDGKLIVNANLYWQDTYNFQTPLVNTDFTDVTGVPISNTFLGNIGHVRFRGVEFDGRWSPIDRLWLTFSGALTEVRYVDFEKGPKSADWGFAGSPGSVNLTGTKATGISPLSFNVGVNYEHPLGAIFHDFGFGRSVSAYTYLNASWKDTTVFSNPWSIYKLEQRPYTLVNVGFGIKTDDDDYNLFFWAKNILDERWLTNQSISAGGGPNTQTYGDPRWFGGTLRVKLY
ncbi:TonB-dependent receptor [Methylosinus sp. H3A]|uniref:TonB-dependent receptor n=1 Tax=Methylosinus sp. H3A TaxID=2785786 RepID=UPI0018C201A6|nr:TonB-dependent receptor [Methylosinus sp. H3A]MBG0808044.1 TonB-dependent receptor [Methylosinus sp. H3A]